MWRPSSPSSRRAAPTSSGSRDCSPTPASAPGFGDLNGNGVLSDERHHGRRRRLAFEQLLYSQNASFNAAADVDGDGLVTNLDLFELGAAAGGRRGQRRGA